MYGFARPRWQAEQAAIYRNENVENCRSMVLWILMVFHEKIRDALVAVPCSDVVIHNGGLLTSMSDFTSD